MTKISLEIDEDLNRQLKQYALDKYGRTHGKQQMIIRDALVAYLKEMSRPAVEVESTVKEMPQEPTKAEAKPKAKRGRKPKKEVPAPSSGDEKTSEAEETGKRKRWNDEEITTLKVMYLDRESMSDIAMAIGRADSTVRSKIKSLIEMGELAERKEMTAGEERKAILGE